MTVAFERRRVLVVGDDASRRPVLESLAYELVGEWETLQAGSFQQARYVLQHEPCDVLLVDGSRYKRGDGAGLSWLAAQQRAPVVLLADLDPEEAAEALEYGANQWLPRELALRHPPLLAAALNQASQLGDLRRRARLAGEALQGCRRQVNRLVGMLWEAAPIDPRARWYTQRHMLERLEEEVARAARHGTPLSVVLGEVSVDPVEHHPRRAEQLARGIAERIGRAKRRHDVAGQYGPHGFMLLLGHTPESGALSCCRRLQEVLESVEAPSLGKCGTVQAFLGVGSLSNTISTPQALLRRAEERLEEARTAGAVGHAGLMPLHTQQRS